MPAANDVRTQRVGQDRVVCGDVDPVVAVPAPGRDLAVDQNLGIAGAAQLFQVVPSPCRQPYPRPTGSNSPSPVRRPDPTQG